MKKTIEKKGFLSILVILLFLAVIPSAAIHAQQTANQNVPSGYTEHWFGDGATVESVREEMLAFDPGVSVTVTDKDGNPRTSGPLDDGDIVRIYDHAGNLYQSFVNVNPESPAGPSSEESAGSSSEVSAGNSSEEERSEPESSQGLPESSASSTAETVLPGNGGYYEFSGPVTVSDLEDQLSEQGVAGSRLTVQSSAGSARQSGAVCTGDVLTVENPDGTLQNRVTAIIPGDLTRCGSPNGAACRALYSYLTGSGTLKSDLRRAADLNGDGGITTSDLLELKKMVSGDG
ncbi:dockerin type I domain-containing protein [Caproicibacter sp. BJN0012]|uniref:dockerin type I domain-containing protein n=1 Tax=Caproicibacter sp. BJN0012 TaxID=3110227 RepID=UPI002E112E24|nr:dockerin type I domain-containing protein [Caproicibacter sp. BJN0012]